MNLKFNSVLVCGIALLYVTIHVAYGAPRGKAVNNMAKGKTLSQIEAEERAEAEKHKRLMIQQQKALVAAVKKGDIAQVQKLLSQHVSPDTTDEKGTTVLMLAIGSSRADIVKVLLGRNASVLYNNTSYVIYAPFSMNEIKQVAKDKNGVNALMLAEQKGTPEILKMVRDAALIQASFRFDIDAAKSMLDKGASLHATDVYGATPLYIAVREVASIRDANWKKEAITFIEFLLQRGADANAPVFFHGPGDEQDRSNMDYIFSNATGSGSIELVRVLIKYGAQVKGDMGAEALASACGSAHANEKQKLQIAQLLLDNGAPINGAHGAPLRGANSSVTRFLLQRGADVNVVDAKGETALFSIADSGNVDSAKLLMEAGANVNIKNKRGETVLHHAGDWIHDKYARLLLAHGADPNSQDTNGLTPLMRAISAISADDEESYKLCGDPASFLKVFVAGGANLNLRDKNGKTALQRARQAKLQHWVKLLTDAGAKV